MGACLPLQSADRLDRQSSVTCKPGGVLDLEVWERCCFHHTSLCVILKLGSEIKLGWSFWVSSCSQSHTRKRLPQSSIDYHPGQKVSLCLNFKKLCDCRRPTGRGLPPCRDHDQLPNLHSGRLMICHYCAFSANLHTCASPEDFPEVHQHDRASR